MSAFIVNPLVLSTSGESVRHQLKICHRREGRQSAMKSMRSLRGSVMTMGGGSPGKAPDGNTITEALEITFRTVWIRLMTAGVGAEYEAAIEQFVVVCVAAYKAGYSLTALKLELAANEGDGPQQFMGQDTRLNDQEKETRLIWMGLVYMTLERYRFPSDNTPPPVTTEFKGTKIHDIFRGLSNLVESVCVAAKRGYTLQTFKMELNLNRDKAAELSPFESNLRSQWSRIVFSTIKVLPEQLKGSK